MKRLNNASARKRLFLAIFIHALIIVATVSSVCASVYAVESTVPDKSLTFLEDVVLLDLTKYEPILQIHDVMYPEELADFPQDNIVYALVSNESQLEAAFGFKNSTFAHFMLGTLQAPFYSEPQPATTVDTIANFVQRYQKYTGDPDFDGARDFEEMVNLLDSVDVTKNVTAASSHVELEVISRADCTLFVWQYVLDGVAFPWISLEFRNGIVSAFDDNWRLFNVGSTSLVYSEVDVMNIALEYLNDFSWTADDEVVTDFEIVEEPRSIELITTLSREPLTLYPCWKLELYLDKVYPGNVNRISLSIWADNGEVNSCAPLGGGGVIPEFDLLTPIFVGIILVIAIFFYKPKLSST
ncbi:MAG: hypothetical protein CW716_03725 [Candidatus Bathyarchaeum sp.]|nr:MAG: hypothetical protein CW716_03725 [Candidatus Bathyarchaeum sp.]